MNSIILAAALAAATVAPVDFAMYDNEVSRLTISHAPCDPAVLELIKEEYQPHFKGARYEGKQGQGSMKACWFPVPGSTLLYIHFEDNDRAFVPMEEFKDVKKGAL